MDEQSQHLGVARVLEKNGRHVLVFPRQVVRLFGLQAGDVVDLRKRRGRKQYIATFWRHGEQLSPLHPFPFLSHGSIKGEKRSRTSTSRIVAAAQREITRRITCAEKLKQLDGRLISAAIRTLGSPADTAEWLICRAHGLGGKVPVDVAATPAGRAEVAILLKRIEYSVLA